MSQPTIREELQSLLQASEKSDGKIHIDTLEAYVRSKIPPSTPHSPAEELAQLWLQSALPGLSEVLLEAAHEMLSTPQGRGKLRAILRSAAAK